MISSATVMTTAMVSPATVIPATAVISSAAVVVVVSPAAALVFVVSPVALVFIVSRAAPVVGFVVVIVTTAFSSRQMSQIGPMFGEDGRQFLLVALFLAVGTGARGTPVNVFSVVPIGN